MKILKKVSAVLVFGLVLGVSGLIAIASTPSLGTTDSFGLLAHTLNYANSGTAITGNLGYTTAAGTGGFPTATATYVAPSPVYTQAGADQATLLAALNSQICTVNLPAGVNLATDTTHGPLGIYTPGVYCTPSFSSASIGVAGITLSGAGTYIFRINGALNTAGGPTYATSSHVLLTNNASVCDVFWTTNIAAAESSLGRYSTFVGTLIEPVKLVLNDHMDWTGRALVYNGLVTVDEKDNIHRPSECPAVPAPATLHIIKHVINNNGGSSSAANFTMHVIGTNVSSSSFPGNEAGTTVTLDAGSYGVSESGPGAYTQSFSSNCLGTIAAGDTKTCTITNDDTPQEPDLLNVVKTVYNDYGGTAISSDFTLHVKLGGVDVPGSPMPGVSVVNGGRNYWLQGNTYSVSEDSFPGYTAIYGGDCDVNGNVTVGLAPKTCIVSNDQNPPIIHTATLHVIKTVINNDGGTAISSDFMLHVKGAGSFGTADVPGSPLPGVAGLGRPYTLEPGDYAVSENSFAGYSSTFSGDCDSSGLITLASDADKTCTITNNDNFIEHVTPATLHVIKKVINDDGGIATVSSFMLHVKTAGSFGLLDVAGSPLPGVATPGRPYTLDPGVYAVSEDTFTGYSSSFSGDCDSSGNITLGSGEDKSCTITNNDDKKPTPPFAYLHVIKTVINNDGGIATPGFFTINVKLGNVQVTGSPAPGAPAPGTLYSLVAGTYTVSENAFSGYTQTFGGDCVDGGIVSLHDGDNKTCYVINDDSPREHVTPATLHVIKKVINNDGGTATVSSFMLHVKGGGSFGLVDVAGSPLPGVATPGRPYTLDPGIYAVSENTFSGYTQSFSGDCDSSGNVTLGSGQDKSCTITNDDEKKPTPPYTYLHVIKTVINNDGGTATPASFTINVKLGNAQVSGSPASGAPAPGTLYSLIGGTYTVSENAFSGYTQSFGGDCVDGGIVTLHDGDNKTCYVINDDIAAHIPPDSTRSPILHVIKKVINDEGGTEVASSFMLHVKNSGGHDVAGSPAFGVVTPGRSYILTAGTYNVSENIFSGYTRSISGDCDANGKVTLVNGDDKTCTITNNDMKVIVVTPPPSNLDTSSTGNPLNGLSTLGNPRLPNTGVDPTESNVPWDVIIASSIFAASFGLYLVMRKQTAESDKN